MSLAWSDYSVSVQYSAVKLQIWLYITSQHTLLKGIPPQIIHGIFMSWRLKCASGREWYMGRDIGDWEELKGRAPFGAGGRKGRKESTLFP